MEATVDRFCQFAKSEEVEFDLLDFAEIRSDQNPLFEVEDGNLVIKLANGKEFDFSKYKSFYFRMYSEPAVDDRDGRIMYYTQSLVSAYLENCDQLVVNRPSAGSSNANKFLHLKSLSEIGFCVPETHLFGSRESALQVIRDTSEWVNKSISSTKTRADQVSEDTSQLRLLKNCPSYFQRLVTGFDVRLHVVGKRHFALQIKNDSGEIDYRFSGVMNSFSKISVPKKIIQLCRDYCVEERLEFCGFDFKVRDGEWIILEANPMPGYDYFDRQLNGEISKYLVKFLRSGKKVNSAEALTDTFYVKKDRRPPQSINYSG